MSVRRWLLVLGVAAVVAGQAGVSGADSLPGLLLTPNPVLIHSQVVISNTPDGECGAGEPPGTVSAFMTFTPPQGEQFRIFTLPDQDGNWRLAFNPDQIGRYDLSTSCMQGVPPHATVVPSSVVTHRVGFDYEDVSFEVVESFPTTVTTSDGPTTTAVALSAQPVITGTEPAFTG